VGICGLVVTSRTRASAIRTSILSIIVDADADAILAMLLSLCRYLMSCGINKVLLFRFTCAA
jgi:hypothetical protein